MEDFRLVLAVLAAIAIIAVLIHGFWSIRRQQVKPLKEKPMTGFYREQAARRDSDGFDADGIGEVRIRKTTAEDKPPQLKPGRGRRGPLAAKAEAAAAEPQDALDHEAGDFALSHSAPEDKPGRNKPKMQRQEPVIHDEMLNEGDLQMELGLAAEASATSVADTDEDMPREPELQPQPVATDNAPSAQQPQAVSEPTDVLILHVVARPGQTLNGAELLPCLLALNFKFGDMQIFHRHEDHAGNGKVLFSLANMLKPGTFDPDNMEQFTTQGVVLFMTLPSATDGVMSFSIMLNSASQLADDLDGLLLDGERNPWQLSTKKEYLDRIKASC
ncbi:cell division protein ZipA [Shewanella sp. YIC-542]|uniref:cell division protein ZipA n=1 Tax=Shewanella mytili TaxID=3377111 RepID=UPI00398E69F5